MLKAYTFLFFLIAVTSAHARLNLLPDFTNSTTAGDKQDYQMGDEWGKKRVTADSMNRESAAFVRAAMATALLPVGGTGFYLGKFNGTHILVTNYHVCPAKKDCVGDKASFKYLKKNFKMTKLLLSLSDIDMALLSLEVSPSDEYQLSRIARNFAFNRPLSKGMDLITIGYGIGGNPDDYMMANQDKDCKVFSKTGDYRYLADPDKINPAGYSAWSFAHGCDISHGDSGSSIIDRNTGDLIGILWTGQIPKSPVVQNSSNLDRFFRASSPEIWNELSFGVPAAKIGEYLRRLSNSSQFSEETRSIFKAIIQ